jgi:phospholipase/carboxylesterase
MSEASHIERLAGLTCRVWRATSQPAAGLAFLLHGLGGDENSMAVFRPALPSRLLVVSPRAPFVVSPGGNSWHTQLAGHNWPLLEDFDASTSYVAALVDALGEPGQLTHPLLIVGFSQGAAAAAAFAFEHRILVDGLALLAGFVPHPSGLARIDQPLRGLPTFVANGTLDTTVPPKKANEAIGLLRAAGASLTSCDAPIGHKVSAQCVRALGEWAGLVVGVAVKKSVAWREGMWDP